MARRCPHPLYWFIFLLVALFTKVHSSSASTVSDATAAATVVKPGLPTSPSTPHFAYLAASPARKSPISVTDAVTICRSPAWELQMSNWIFSNAQEWLELYTLRFKDSYEVKQHGLVGSIAYRYLGEPNFRCGVGMTQSCVVWCRDVVMAVEDLEEARNVYFVLSSVAHFTAVADLVHSGLEAAQNNVGLMAPKMAYTFYWWKETPDERKRAIILHFTLLGTQHMFRLLSPFLPWMKVVDQLADRLDGYSAELQRAKEHEHIAWLFMRTAHMLNVEWGWTMRNREANPLVDQERGFYLHATGLRGDRTNRYWRDSYGASGNWWNYEGEEWTPSKRAFWKAHELVWRTPRGVGWNALDKYTIDGWRRRIDEQPEQGGNVIPPSHHEYTKLGYWQERTKAFNDLIAWKAQREEDNSQFWVDASKMGWSVFTGWLPEVFMGINLWTSQPEEMDRGPELNAANLAMHIGRMTSDSRQALQQGFLDMMNPTEIAENGETTLSITLGRGHYLPANDQLLKSFTAGDIEQRITKSIFHKTLNAALKSQTIYITCTTDIKNRKKPSNVAKKGRRAVSCKKDNSGPQELKACVPYTAEEGRARGLGDAPGELACYMYKWSTRGQVARHHNEAPFGSDEWAQNWGIAARDIITSSVRAHLMGITDDGESLSHPGAFESASASDITDPTTPGVFTVPVCVTRHNQNAPVKAFTVFSELNQLSPSKLLPCSCGYWGDETERLWRDIGLWDEHPDEYRKTLCPQQIRSFTDDPLEKFVGECRLGTKKSPGSSSSSRRFGRDSRCRVVSWLLDRLKAEGVAQDLPESLHLAIWCRINKGWWSDLTACRGVDSDTPYSDILRQLDGIARDRTPPPDITHEEFWNEVEALDVYDELLLKPFGLSNGTRHDHNQTTTTTTTPFQSVE